MQSNIVEVSSKVMHLSDTVATRQYPFTQETLDQLHDLREVKEREHFESTGESVIFPAPVLLAEAVDMLHQHYFYVPHAEE